MKIWRSIALACDLDQLEMRMWATLYRTAVTVVRHGARYSLVISVPPARRIVGAQ